MAEHRGNRLEAHAPVDALGREGVAELVRMDVSDPSALRDCGDVAVDGPSVNGLAVVAHDEQPGETRPACLRDRSR